MNKIVFGQSMRSQEVLTPKYIFLANKKSSLDKKWAIIKR